MVNEAWDGLLNTVCVYNKLLSHTLYICINCEIVIYGHVMQYNDHVLCVMMSS